MNQEKCQDLLENLSLFVEGEAPPELCSRIERHLARCANCRIVVDTLRRMINLYQRLPRPEIPEEARERLFASLDLGEFLPPEGK
jgi:RNA polymerase sigma-70 factor (ECF subfamily)